MGMWPTAERVSNTPFQQFREVIIITITIIVVVIIVIIIIIITAISCELHSNKLLFLDRHHVH